MTPPGSVMISARLNRGLAYESKGDYEHARADFAATLAMPASDAGSVANQETAKVRLSLLSDTNVAPSPLPAAPAGRRAALVIGNVNGRADEQTKRLFLLRISEEKPMAEKPR